MNVLVAYETSGVLSGMFRNAGHFVHTVDLLPAENEDLSEFHIQGDALYWIKNHGRCYDLIVAHPPCTYLSGSGLHWNGRVPGRAEKTEDAKLHFMALVGLLEDLEEKHGVKWVIENPVGCMSTHWRKADNYVQPYEFGDDASKKTCLWTGGLPTIVKDPGLRVPGRIVEKDGKKYERWANQTDSGQNRLGPSEDRWQVRSRTYKGVAKAIVEQWS